MSLNWKEIELILREAELDKCKIQKVIQSSFNSVTWQLYKLGKGRFDFYTEVGTDKSRIHTVGPDKKPAKTKKLQRFEQFARKNLEGSVITKCVQMPFDRLVCWEIDNHTTKMKIWLRLYSASGANIIVTDENNKILDLLLRRPGRNEISGSIFTPEIRTQDTGNFTVRKYQGSFNNFIETYYDNCSKKDNTEDLIKQIKQQKEKELSIIENSIHSTKRTIDANKDWENLKNKADLLSAVSYQIPAKTELFEVTDWSTNKKIILKLNPSLSGGDNVQLMYEKYRKTKKTWENAKEELKRLEKKYNKCKETLTLIESTSSEEDALYQLVKNNFKESKEHEEKPNHPGLHIVLNGWDLIIGRNAKENDELLRHYAKPDDMWFHTRDFPGGYVFVKYKKNKTIPLEVMLQAGNFASFFSKGRDNSSVDLYYTNVKHLRRAKKGKTGLVLPTQEKNLTIKPNVEKTKALLSSQESNP